MKIAILFIGLPGSGKGTQAKVIYDAFRIPSYSMGELLRSYSESDKKDALFVKETIQKGLIVPGDLVNNIVKDVIENTSKACILDGYPRSLEQAKFLASQEKIKIVPIYFEVDENLLLKRILNRIQCKKCGSVYNLEVLDKLSFNCSECGSTDLYKRTDDSHDILQNRIQQFKNNTIPVLDFYKNLGLLYKVDGSRKVNDISQDLIQIIKNLDIDI